MSMEERWEAADLLSVTLVMGIMSAGLMPTSSLTRMTPIMSVWS